MIGSHLMFAKPYDIEEVLTAIETLLREEKRISVE
jgi:DNA-binding response OmpR family regulator